jgi:hypothetical protein
MLSPATLSSGNVGLRSLSEAIPTPIKQSCFPPEIQEEILFHVILINR